MSVSRGPAGRRRGVAIVGLGMAVAPHARSLLDLSDRVDVRHAVSRSAERREAFSRHFPFATTDDLARALADDAVDLVAVLTPANTHLDIVERCAAAGKHVLLEKPLDVSTERARTLVGRCEAAGVTLGIVLQHRFRPAAEALAARLREGALGTIIGCSTSIRLWRPQSYYDEPGRGTLARDGGGVLISQGIHTLDLMLSLAGPVREVTGFTVTSPVHRMETEDMVAAALRFENGALGTVDATTAAYPGFPERIEIIGRDGTAVLSGPSLSIAYQDGRRESVATDGAAGGTGADPMAFPHDWHRSVWIDILDAIDAGRRPRIDGREALKVHRLIDALIEAGRSSGPVRIASEVPRG